MFGKLRRTVEQHTTALANLAHDIGTVAGTMSSAIKELETQLRYYRKDQLDLRREVSELRSRLRATEARTIGVPNPVIPKAPAAKKATAKKAPAKRAPKKES